MDNRNKKEKAPAVKKEEYAVVLDYLSRGYVKSDMSKFGGYTMTLSYLDRSILPIPTAPLCSSPPLSTPPAATIPERL